MHDNSRQRLAWTFLFLGFFSCLLLTVSVPLMANAAVHNAMQPLAAVLQANQGTVVVNDRSTSWAVLPANSPSPLSVGQSVQTNAADLALMSVAAPEGGPLLAHVDFYGNTSTTIEAAEWPRFALSSQDARLVLQLHRGRLRLKLLPIEEGGRPLHVTITSEHGTVEVNQPGQYSIESVNGDTQLYVQSGLARAESNDQVIEIGAEERAVFSAGSPPVGPLDGERNLIRNGDFSQELNNWTVRPWEIERPDQPEGSARVNTESGEPVFYVRRDGIGHAEVTLYQFINQDVTDYQSLHLRVSFRIDEQSVAVCGVVGSECPLMVRIEYDDINGVPHIWQQGFYAVGQIVPDQTPPICEPCAVVQQTHRQVPLGQLYPYETDLLRELAQQGELPPSRIKSISLEIAGHTFETEVADVALTGKE